MSSSTWWALIYTERGSIEEVLSQEQEPAVSDFGNGIWPEKIYSVRKLRGRPIFVNWDPLHERPVCIHKSEDGKCPACIAVQEKADRDHCYFVEGRWFEVQD